MCACKHTHTHTQIYVLCSVKSDLSTGRSVSRLFIADANRQDSGNYTCALGDYVKATVAVHVLAGKYTANTLSRTNTKPPNRHTNTETHARHTPFPIRDLPLMIAQHMWHKCVRAQTHTHKHDKHTPRTTMLDRKWNMRSRKREYRVGLCRNRVSANIRAPRRTPEKD